MKMVTCSMFNAYKQANNLFIDLCSRPIYKGLHQLISHFLNHVPSGLQCLSSQQLTRD